VEDNQENKLPSLHSSAATPHLRPN